VKSSFDPGCGLEANERKGSRDRLHDFSPCTQLDSARHAKLRRAGYRKDGYRRGDLCRRPDSARRERPGGRLRLPPQLVPERGEKQGGGRQTPRFPRDCGTRSSRSRALRSDGGGAPRPGLGGGSGSSARSAARQVRRSPAISLQHLSASLVRSGAPGGPKGGRSERRADRRRRKGAPHARTTTGGHVATPSGAAEVRSARSLIPRSIF
jgi:hypothetical protein